MSRTPVLFLGHGSPMNAISENRFTETLRRIGSRLPKPRAVLCISAHWMTNGTYVTAMKRPKTIHDFHGFPQELFAIEYPAPGLPSLATRIQKTVQTPAIQLDENNWGLDHGTWAVLRHLFPEADVPVLQLSLDLQQPPEFHYELGQSLRFLREEGVLILGSGNIVHNLRQIRWEPNAEPFSWARDFEGWFRQNLLTRKVSPLLQDYLKIDAGALSVPTPDHYFPAFYILGAAAPEEKASIEFEEIQNGSISMLSFSFGDFG